MTKTPFLSSDCVGCPAKDIGTGIGRSDLHLNGVIASDAKIALNEMYEVVGANQVTRRRLDVASPWILAKALKSEVKANRIGAYTEIYEIDVPQNANVIASHFLNKIKPGEKGVKRLKVRLWLHGNRDRFKKSVRKDSAAR